MAQVTQQCQDMTAEISVSSVFDEMLNTTNDRDDNDDDILV